MGKFSFNDYQNAISAAQGKGTGVKVGFFKLANDGDKALVRFNIASVEDLDFASVHTISANGKWLKVSCLSSLGNFTNTCPLCAASETVKSISQAKKMVYLQMLASYFDRATGSYSAPVPVIWERPAAFSKEIATKLSGYGSLKEHTFMITRNGLAGDMKTTYSLDCLPIFDNENIIGKDFSAFANFDIAKHSYWEKTEEEIRTFLTTGSFPEVIKQSAKSTAAPVAPAAQAYTAPAAQAYTAPAAPVYATPVTPTPVTPVAPTPVAEAVEFKPQAAAPVTPATPVPAQPEAVQSTDFNTSDFSF